jgi:hypothetical protein
MDRFGYGALTKMAAPESTWNIGRWETRARKKSLSFKPKGMIRQTTNLLDKAVGIV